MSQTPSDALVFFGATGDLAYKKIFPALQRLAKRGRLNMPVIGVAKAGWNLDQLKARAKDSVEHYGGLDADGFAKLMSVLKYIDGDYSDEDNFSQTSAGTGKRPASSALFGNPSKFICGRREKAGWFWMRRRGPGGG